MELTGNVFSFPWEASLMEWLQTHLSGAVPVTSFFSAFGEELIMILLLGFFYWWYDKKAGKSIGLSVLMGIVWNPMIKNIFLRRRPYFDHAGIRILRVVEPKADPMDIAAQGFSFPSGHSTDAVAMYGSLGRYFKKKWLIAAALALPLLVGFSRVVVGAHYPTDVFAGWALGLLVMLLVPWLQKKLRKDWLLYLVLLLTALPGFFYCKSEDYFTAVGLMIGFMAGSLFEDRKVRFLNTRSVPCGLLRLAGGLALYFAVNFLLKAPFPSDFLNSGTMAALLVRAARYAVIAFLEFGVYPMAFARVEGFLFKNKNQASVSA